MHAFRFDLVDLRLFLNVAELESLSRGAERSNISLAAASTRIKNLELNLGVQVFNRTSRGITLTPPGQTMLKHAASVLAQLNQMTADLHQYSAGKKRQLRIGTNITCLSEVAPKAMREFLALYPSVDVELIYYHSPDGLRALREDAIDIALVAGSIRDPGIEVISLCQEDSVVVTQRNHPLSLKSVVSFSDILNYELIGLGGGAARHPEYVRLAKALKKPINFRINLNSFEEMCRAVADGIGVAVVPRSLAVRFSQVMELEVIAVGERWARRQHSLCLRRPRMLPDYVDDLIELIKKSADEAILAPNDDRQDKEARQPRTAVGRLELQCPIAWLAQPN